MPPRAHHQPRRFDITLVGETNLDLLLLGLPDDLPPERELLVEKMALSLGGSAAITAHNLAALGVRVGFITTAADDLFARSCLEDLERAGVDLSRTVRSANPTATGVTVLMQHARFRRSLTYPGNSTGLRFDDLDLEYLREGRHFHLSSFFLQRHLMGEVPRLFAELKRAGLTISLDTNDDPFDDWTAPVAEALQFVDLLMPNEREACRLAHEGDIERAVIKLTGMVPVVVLKRGVRGATLYHGSKREDASAIGVASIDAVGAGDSFNAGFLSAYVNGSSLRECLELGVRTGAYSTTRMGGTAAFCDRKRMEDFLRTHALP